MRSEHTAAQDRARGAELGVQTAALENVLTAPSLSFSVWRMGTVLQAGPPHRVAASEGSWESPWRSLRCYINSRGHWWARLGSRLLRQPQLGSWEVSRAGEEGECPHLFAFRRRVPCAPHGPALRQERRGLCRCDLGGPPRRWQGSGQECTRRPLPICLIFKSHKSS